MKRLVAIVIIAIGAAVLYKPFSGWLGPDDYLERSQNLHPGMPRFDVEKIMDRSDGSTSRPLQTDGALPGETGYLDWPTDKTWPDENGQERRFEIRVYFDADKKVTRTEIQPAKQTYHGRAP
jgi:hypothetical protein